VSETLRIEPDGTRVFRHRGKICRTTAVAPERVSAESAVVVDTQQPFNPDEHPDARFVGFSGPTTKRYWWNGRYYDVPLASDVTVIPAPPVQTMTSVYSPYCGRAAFYKATGGKDHRDGRWFEEAVRERRQRVGCYYRAVKQGTQRME
jgi:hypothetical protein